jgi:hypothetical protein
LWRVVKERATFYNTFARISALLKIKTSRSGTEKSRDDNSEAPVTFRCKYFTQFIFPSTTEAQ